MSRFLVCPSLVLKGSARAGKGGLNDNGRGSFLSPP
jgi:hypothetical protein